MLSPWPLVGRSHELGLVAELLTLEERPAIILSGLPGVGKSSLAAACLEAAGRRGLATARVQGNQAASRLPFGALAPLLPGTQAPSREPAGMLLAAREAIVGLGAGQRLVLLVDDAHLLDEASATLVHQLATTRSAFVLATVRAKEPAPDPVVALWKDQLAERIEVPALGADAVEGLLVEVLGGPITGATLRQLVDRSAGNALYLRELVLAGVEAGTLHEEDGVWRLSGAPVVSSRLVELIEARLAGVQDPGRKVLDALAFGERLGVRCLETVTTAQVLQELEARGLIVTAYHGRRLDATLAHPLYGEVIRARIPALRSQIVRQGLADRVQAVGARRREDALRFATWRLDAGGEMAPDLMITAATTARHRWDLNLAARLAEAAVRAGGGFEAALLSAEVAVLQGRSGEADERLATLLPLAADDDQRMRVVSARVENLVTNLGRSEEALRVIDAAEALVSEPVVVDQLAAKRAFVLHMTGRLAEAFDVLGPVLARAEGPAFVFAWYIGGSCLTRTGRFAEALVVSEKSQQATSPADGGEPDRPWLPIVVRVCALAGAGRLAEAEALARSEYDAAVATESRTLQAMWSLYLARVYALMGVVNAAARSAREATGSFRERELRNLLRTGLTQLALAHALGGSAEQAAVVLAEIEGLDMPADDLNDVELQRARAWTAAAGGDQAAAREHLRAAAALARERGDLVWESEALHDLARLGRPAPATARLAELADLVEGELAPARAEHAAALVAQDPARLQAVSATFEAMSAWLAAAEAAAAAAVVLRRDGDPRRAAAAEVRAAELARRCQGAVTPALRDIETQALLSSREIEVAALASAGLANKEIARRLSVSVRTVENHLQRVYEKLGVARRADLGQALASF